jgi:hypothetical protein
MPKSGNARLERGCEGTRENASPFPKPGDERKALRARKLVHPARSVAVQLSPKAFNIEGGAAN